MVKTRHSDGHSPQSGPVFISLEGSRRHSTRTTENENADDDLCVSRAYNMDGSNAFNIFEEKSVGSRLRSRSGPSRAYNYLDQDSSDEDSRQGLTSRRNTLLSPRNRSSERRQKDIRTQHIQEQQDRKRTSRLRSMNFSMEEDSDGTDFEFEASGDSKRETRSKLNRSNRHSFDSRTSHARHQSPTAVNGEAESDKETQGVERSVPTRRRQSQEGDKSQDNSSRKQHQQEVKDEGTEEMEEEEHVRRSTRTRTQPSKMLDESCYIQGRRGNDDGQEDEDEEKDPDKKFTDMYSRVKRKRVQIKRNMYGVPIEDSDSEEEDDDQEEEDEEEDDDDDEEEENEDTNNNKDEEQDEDEEINQNNQNRRVLRNRRSLRRPQTHQNIVRKKYSLRQHKPAIDRYKPPEEKRRKKRADHSVFVRTTEKKNSQGPYRSPARIRNIKKRSALNSSSSSTSSSDSDNSDEKSHKRRKSKSIAKARNRMMPMNMTADALASASVIKDRVKSGVSLADVEPMTIDKNVTFDNIGGLGAHIRKLKEMVAFPLLYSDVFHRFKVDPPRGVLFYGPPGTGKTLVARALANECSQGDRKVAFFMRKGADCLSKWVGESERQLRLLFDQAYKFRPSIIFFDEIDGLAPVRSSRQDQIHSSIVSTLLALMDGLDSRGEIVVIGATNRIDSLDPALRRPGRFDREFLFPLPSMESRKQILKIHTNSWNPRLNDNFLSELAEKSVGYCGADLKALCTEAAMLALRRRYPQIYLTREALKLDVSSINVSAKDFFNAISNIIPTSQRSVNTPARALAPRVAPLLQLQLDNAMDKLADVFPASSTDTVASNVPATMDQAKKLAEMGIPWEELLSDEDEDMPSIFVPSTHTSARKTVQGEMAIQQNYLNFTSFATSKPTPFRPRLMLVGCPGQGQTTHLAPAVIHRMESLPVHVLDLPTLYAVTAKTPEESCANVFHEAKRKCPSIVYLPYIDQWWDTMAETLRATLLTLIQDLNPAMPILLLATSERPYATLDHTLKSLFSTSSCEVIVMRNPNREERHTFFQDLILRQTAQPPPQKKQAEAILEHLKMDSLKNLKVKEKRINKRKVKQAKPLPNYIYPFGCYETPQTFNKVNNSNFTTIAKATSVTENNNPTTALKKNSTNKIKVFKEACSEFVKNCHHMRLRPRIHVTGKLNRNQSARQCSVPHSSIVLRSKRPAGVVRKLGCGSQQLTQISRCLENEETSCFKKPLWSPPSQMVRSEPRFRLVPWTRGAATEGDNLSSRHERYLRRLHRLEGKLSVMATNLCQHDDAITPASTADYHALSARHLRYIRRLRKIDVAMLHAESSCFPGQALHSLMSSYQARQVLSCGSFQMYKRNSQAISSRLSLPMNLQDLTTQHRGGKGGRRRNGTASGKTRFSSRRPGKPRGKPRGSCKQKVKGFCSHKRVVSNPCKNKTLSGLTSIKPFKEGATSSVCSDPPHCVKLRPRFHATSKLNSNQSAQHSEVLEHSNDIAMNHKSDTSELEFSTGLNGETSNSPLESLKLRAMRLQETLPLATAPPPAELSKAEVALLVEKEELTLMELRIFLRDVLHKLGTDKKFSIFAKPVNIEDATDYYDIIETPMDLSSMMAKIDLHEYGTVRDFLNDIDLICHNALEYNPDRGPMDRVIRHRACALKDTAYAIIKTELDKEFEKMCAEIQESRQRRCEKSGSVPDFYNTRLRHGPTGRTQQTPGPSTGAAGSGLPSYLDRPQLERSIPKPDGMRYSRRVRGITIDPVPPLEVVEKVYKSARSGTNGTVNGEGEDGEGEDTQGGGCEQTEEIACVDSKEEEGKNEKWACVEGSAGKGKASMSPTLPPSGSKKDNTDGEEDVDKCECKNETSGAQPDNSSPGTDSKLNKGNSSASPKTSRAKRNACVWCRPKRKRPRSSPVRSDGKASSGKRSLKGGEEGEEEDEDVVEESAAKKIHTEPRVPKVQEPAGNTSDREEASFENVMKASTEPSDKPKAVKRLDLDVLITDSGHGSSLESNCDSRDSTTHKPEVNIGDSVSKKLPNIEALVNNNSNCSGAPCEQDRIVVDPARLSGLLERLVSGTQGCSVERLEKIYSTLSIIIYRHRRSLDRTLMLEEMERKVKDLTTTTSPR